MAKVITTELQHSGASAANITLDSSKNVTCENNLQVDGNVTVTGTLPADKLTGALPAISGASLTGITSQDTLSFRNLIVNGACDVAQRGTSDTSDGQSYTTVDRWQIGWNGLDNVVEKYQGSITSSDTGPWELGFRNSFKIVNGNQTSGAGAADFLNVKYRIESQDLATSGWDYQDPNSKVTISFWAKSSVAQTFYWQFETHQSTTKHYVSAFTLAANTWTKFTKTVGGDSQLNFADSNAQGMSIFFLPFYGTDYTASGFTLDTWAAVDGNSQAPDMTSTWYTTNDATLEWTGLQLEVGDTATTFEHRTYGEELQRCKRYYQRVTGEQYCFGRTSGAAFEGSIRCDTPMRAQPSIALEGAGTPVLRMYSMDNATNSSNTPSIFGWNNVNESQFGVYQDGHSGHTDNRAATARIEGAKWLKLDAEL